MKKWIMAIPIVILTFGCGLADEGKSFLCTLAFLAVCILLGALAAYFVNDIKLPLR